MAYFDERGSLTGATSFVQSHHGLYYFETQQYSQSNPDRNWVVTKIQIGHIEKDGSFFEYLTDHEDIAFAWIYADQKDYLILPECLGGQSVFDVSERKLYSNYSVEDPFIWQHIVPSPNQNLLAVEGCYKGYPSELLVYDCSNITSLPYPVKFRTTLPGQFQLKEWFDEENLVLTDKEGNAETLRV